MKKLTFLLVIMISLISFAGCTSSGNGQEDAAQKSTEQVSEDNGASVSVNGDKVTVNDKEGNSWTVGDNQWPTSDIVKNIPEFSSGTITSVLDSADAATITIESASESDVTAYFETIKRDFTVNSYEATVDGMMTYGAINGNGIGVDLQYTVEDILIISVYKKTE